MLKKTNPKVLNPLFDVSPDQVAIIGDTNDMKTAVNAKLGLSNGCINWYRKRENFMKRMRMSLLTVLKM